MKIIGLNNGNEIYANTSTKGIRGHRAKLMSFYCPYCNEVHVDYNYHDNNFYNIDGSIFCWRFDELLDKSKSNTIKRLLEDRDIFNKSSEYRKGYFDAILDKSRYEYIVNEKICNYDLDLSLNFVQLKLKDSKEK